LEGTGLFQNDFWYQSKWVGFSRIDISSCQLTLNENLVINSFIENLTRVTGHQGTFPATILNFSISRGIQIPQLPSTNFLLHSHFLVYFTISYNLYLYIFYYLFHLLLYFHISSIPSLAISFIPSFAIDHIYCYIFTSSASSITSITAY
jgi:hypothetical protein